MKVHGIVLLVVFSLLSGCTETKINTSHKDALVVQGRWVTEQDGQVMGDPQTSGLIKWRGNLLTLSDRSAHASQRLRLRKIEQASGRLQPGDMPMKLSERVASGCFAAYLSGNPDLEALAVDPDDDRVFYVATEDASSATLSEACQQQFAHSGSTHYPSLLIRLVLQADNSLTISHVRPIQFSADMHIGDFPNDGLEALTFGTGRSLYLGLEKDSRDQARIFSLKIDAAFWQNIDFAPVREVKLRLPKFDQGNHPINGMAYYQHQGAGYLIAAARNDESLWIIDLAAQKDTRIVPLKFDAPIIPGDTSCGEWERMDNASIEGVAVDGSTLWLINDPWKLVYAKNIQCELNRTKFENMAPLIFSLPIQDQWFN
ncbi:MAG: hypothetical protein ACI965_001997 [Paraglaciecola sp.]|jgi:hypothetical protein